MAQDDGDAAEDLKSAFAARLRAVSGSDKPSEIRASEAAAAMREKAEAARRKADSVKSDAADFLAGGKKQVAAGRAYDGDDLAEVRHAGSRYACASSPHPSACARLRLLSSGIARIPFPARQLPALLAKLPRLTCCVPRTWPFLV
jgi:hypothetical protein